jgi:KDO2-lipid IV(A) lauroyltransferase
MQASFFSLVFRALSLVPPIIQRGLSRPLGAVSWALSRTKRSSTRKNLAAAYPRMDAADRENMGRASMRHYVLIALETGISWYWSHRRLERLFTEPAGLAHLREAREAGRGLLVLAPHFGNWELLNQWLQTRCELVSLYKPGRYASFEERLLEKRQRFGGKLVPTNRAGLRELVQFLKSGRTALLLPDQDPSAGQGRFAPFFGVQALTGVLASRLARQTGCRVVFAVARRVPGGRFQVHVLPAEETFYAADIEQSLAALNRGVEACVALDPPQYLWAYKRFKTRPEGEPRFY